MPEKATNATIEILGKYYVVRCTETELKSLQEAALYLNQKMLEVQESGKAINLERIAIITALNMANQLLQQDGQKSNVMQKINQKLVSLQNKLDSALSETLQTEMIYSAE